MKPFILNYYHALIDQYQVMELKDLEMERQLHGQSLFTKGHLSSHLNKDLNFQVL